MDYIPFSRKYSKSHSELVSESKIKLIDPELNSGWQLFIVIKRILIQNNSADYKINNVDILFTWKDGKSHSELVSESKN